MKLPLHYQIYSKLKAQIGAGQYAPGDMLPTEDELIKAFGTSRAPIRQALGTLENEGLINRRPGKGTFVASLHEDLLLWFNFSPFQKSIRKGWDVIRCETFAADMRQPPEEVREFLFLEKKQPAMYVERVRFHASQPVILSQHYFHPSFDLRGIPNINTLFSVRAALMEHFSLEVTRMDDTLSAVLASPRAIERLALDGPQPILLTERRSYSSEAPVQFDYFYTRTDVWNYHVVFEKGVNGTIAAASGKASTHGPV